MKTSTYRVFAEGFFAGLLGYAAVALVLAAVDLFAGRSPLHTADYLGRTVVGEFGDDGIAPGPVFAYNGLHLLAFLVVGQAAAWLLYEVERVPALWYVVFFLFLAAFVMSTVILMAVGDPAAGGLPWGAIVAANLAAAVLMGAYLRARHPRLFREVEAHGDPEVDGTS